MGGCCFCRRLPPCLVYHEEMLAEFCLLIRTELVDLCNCRTHSYANRTTNSELAKLARSK